MMQEAREQRGRQFGTKQAILIVLALIAIVFIYLGVTKYGFWDEFKGPRPGFFPVIISIALLAVTVFALFASFKEQAPQWSPADWLVPLSVLCIMGTTFLIGLLPSLAIYVVVWLRWLEKCTWKTTITVFVIVMAIVIGVFVLWLGVPFPKGIIYNALVY